VIEAHELPASPPRPAGHDGGRARGIADLHVQRIEHAPVVQDHIDDEPVVEEPKVGHRRAEQRAHSAVRAVAADEVAAGDDAAVLGGDGHRILVLAEVGDRAGAADLHAELERALLERGVQARLVEHRRHRPSGRAQPPATQAEERHPFGVSPLVDVGGLGHLAQLIADPGGLEDAPDLVVEVDSSREPVALRLSFEDRHGVAALSQQDRQGETNGPTADDDHIGRGGGGGGGHGWRRGWWPQALMRS
jgi:hypothetical protein